MARKKLDKEIIESLYKKGLSASEISERLEHISASSVQKCITRNFKHLKEIHKENRKTRQEDLRILKYQEKKFISDSALLKYNRQSFIYDENYNLIFNESDERGKRPDGLPSKYIRAI